MAAKQKREKERRRAKLAVFLRFYEEYDLSVIAFIRDQAKRNDRTVLQQVRQMVRTAATEREAI